MANTLIHDFSRGSSQGNRVKVHVHQATELRFMHDMIRISTLSMPGDRDKPRNTATHSERTAKTIGWFAVACNEPTADFRAKQAVHSALAGFENEYNWLLSRQNPYKTADGTEATLDALLKYGKHLVAQRSPGAPISAVAALFRSEVTNRLLRKQQTYASLGNIGTGMAVVARDGVILDEKSLDSQGVYESDGFQWNMGQENSTAAMASTPLERGDRVFLVSPSMAGSTQELAPYVRIQDPRELGEALYDHNERIYEKVAFVATI